MFLIATHSEVYITDRYTQRQYKGADKGYMTGYWFSKGTAENRFQTIPMEPMK